MSQEHGTVSVAETGDHPERFENPGLPPHSHRLADDDPGAAKRAERQVVLLFALSALGTLGAIVLYFVLNPEDGNFAQLRNFGLGVGLCMGLSLLGIGFGVVHYAKVLMPDHERVEMRHVMRGSDEDREAAAKILKEGGEEAGFGRRPLLLSSMLGAMALFPLPGIFLLGDMGPLPKEVLRRTMWKQGTRLTLDADRNETPIKASDVTLGSVYHVVPEGLKDSHHRLEEKSKAIVLLVRIDPKAIKQPDAKRDSEWAVDGIYAYSKVCTHVGCPVALYEQQTHHLLCPCHQSTFDLTQYCKVVFGPAKRPLPQLPITVDSQGYLVAKSDFHEPVGPSFWERG